MNDRFDDRTTIDLECSRGRAWKQDAGAYFERIANVRLHGGGAPLQFHRGLTFVADALPNADQGRDCSCSFIHYWERGRRMALAKVRSPASAPPEASTLPPPTSLGTLVASQKARPT